MLVRNNTANRRLADGDLAALGGEQIFCSEFTYRTGYEIFGQGEEAVYIYQIITGAVRTHMLLPDGRRQITAFHLPGDLFGLENRATHRFTAEAILNTKVCLTRRCNLLGATFGRDPGAAKLLHGLIDRTLRHAESHMLLLGRKTAVERVSAFLLEMDERLAHPDVMTLPMTRLDIADYLGLTFETVSRALSILKDQEILQFEGKTGRKIVLIDRIRLAQFDGSLERTNEIQTVVRNHPDPISDAQLAFSQDFEAE
jgi:CRP/FNR family nitrogen fixation transcriptional regulator